MKLFFNETFILTILFFAVMDIDHNMFDENIGLWIVALALNLFCILSHWNGLE